MKKILRFIALLILAVSMNSVYMGGVVFAVGGVSDGSSTTDVDAALTEAAEAGERELGTGGGYDDRTAPTLGTETPGATSTNPAGAANSSSSLASTSFMFDTGKINPSSNPTAFSNQGSTQNVKKFLEKVAQTLLVIVSTGAVLFIVIGGFFMVTSAGDTEKANRGKIIITYNIIALAIAMLSYGIMRLVVWIIG